MKEKFLKTFAVLVLSGTVFVPSSSAFSGTECYSGLAPFIDGDILGIESQEKDSSTPQKDEAECHGGGMNMSVIVPMPSTEADKHEDEAFDRAGTGASSRTIINIPNYSVNQETSSGGKGNKNSEEVSVTHVDVTEAVDVSARVSKLSYEHDTLENDNQESRKRLKKLGFNKESDKIKEFGDVNGVPAGIVCVKKIKGKPTIVVGFHGSANMDDWITDFSFLMAKCDFLDGAKVHGGFLKRFTKVKYAMLTEVDALVKEYPDADILVTGHSLGGALATLGALYLQRYYNENRDGMVTYAKSGSQGKKNVSVITYCSPRVLSKKAQVLAEKLIPSTSGRAIRFWRKLDVVTCAASNFLGFSHHGRSVEIVTNLRGNHFMGEMLKDIKKACDDINFQSENFKKKSLDNEKNKNKNISLPVRSKPVFAKAEWKNGMDTEVTKAFQDEVKNALAN